MRTGRASNSRWHVRVLSEPRASNPDWSTNVRHLRPKQPRLQRNNVATVPMFCPMRSASRTSFSICNGEPCTKWDIQRDANALTDKCRVHKSVSQTIWWLRRSVVNTPPIGCRFSRTEILKTAIQNNRTSWDVMGCLTSISIDWLRTSSNTKFKLPSNCSEVYELSNWQNMIRCDAIRGLNNCTITFESRYLSSVWNEYAWINEYSAIDSTYRIVADQFLLFGHIEELLFHFCIQLREHNIVLLIEYQHSIHVLVHFFGPKRSICCRKCSNLFWCALLDAIRTVKTSAGFVDIWKAEKCFDSMETPIIRCFCFCNATPLAITVQRCTLQLLQSNCIVQNLSCSCRIEAIQACGWYAFDIPHVQTSEYIIESRIQLTPQNRNKQLGRLQSDSNVFISSFVLQCNEIIRRFSHIVVNKA